MDQLNRSKTGCILVAMVLNASNYIQVESKYKSKARSTDPNHRSKFDSSDQKLDQQIKCYIKIAKVRSRN